MINYPYSGFHVVLIVLDLRQSTTCMLQLICFDACIVNLEFCTADDLVCVHAAYSYCFTNEVHYISTIFFWIFSEIKEKYDCEKREKDRE